jgi:hypothetical protein
MTNPEQAALHVTGGCSGNHVAVYLICAVRQRMQHNSLVAGTQAVSGEQHSPIAWPESPRPLDAPLPSTRSLTDPSDWLDIGHLSLDVDAFLFTLSGVSGV